MIVVIMGGISAEREVSLQSGQAIFNALQQHYPQVQVLDWTGDNLDELLALKPTKVFIALHGGDGEDGRLQQLLEEHAIAYTGSDAHCSQNALDKAKTQAILHKHHLPIAPSIIATKTNIPPIHFSEPFAVKPTTEGSSIGISKATKTTLNDALQLALQYSDEALIEQWIDAREITVPIITINGKHTPLPPVEITTSNEFYDYEAKYLTDATAYLCPAPISEDLTKKLQNLALEVFNVMKCKTWARVDFLVEHHTENIYILEINTVPGMTSHSLVPFSAREFGISFEQLVLNILK
jgi:D-alanine-D-alanine ligase